MGAAFTRERPFCLIVSHKAMHTCRLRRRRGTGLPLRGRTYPEPANFNETFAGKPAWQRRYKLCGLSPETWDACDPDAVPAAFATRSRGTRKTTSCSPTCARCSRLMTAMGLLLLGALESVGQLDNTLVVFTSDNGFLLGAHRLFKTNA